MLRALISVWDKTGILDFTTQLSDANWHLVADSGTACTPIHQGSKVTSIFALTGEPDILTEQITCLHPAGKHGVGVLQYMFSQLR